MLKQAALDAVDALIAEHGWPWNTSGDVRDLALNRERARAMLALAFVEGYGLGLTVMRSETERVFAAMREELS